MTTAPITCTYLDREAFARAIREDKGCFVFTEGEALIRLPVECAIKHLRDGNLDELIWGRDDSGAFLGRRLPEDVALARRLARLDHDIPQLRETISTITRPENRAILEETLAKKESRRARYRAELAAARLRPLAA